MVRACDCACVCVGGGGVSVKKRGNHSLNSQRIHNCRHNYGKCPYMYLLSFESEYLLTLSASGMAILSLK